MTPAPHDISPSVLARHYSCVEEHLFAYEALSRAEQTVLASKLSQVERLRSFVYSPVLWFRHNHRSRTVSVCTPTYEAGTLSHQLSVLKGTKSAFQEREVWCILAQLIHAYISALQLEEEIFRLLMPLLGPENMVYIPATSGEPDSSGHIKLNIIPTLIREIIDRSDLRCATSARAEPPSVADPVALQFLERAIKPPQFPAVFNPLLVAQATEHIASVLQQILDRYDEYRLAYQPLQTLALHSRQSISQQDAQPQDERIAPPYDDSFREIPSGFFTMNVQDLTAMDTDALLPRSNSHLSLQWPEVYSEGLIRTAERIAGCDSFLRYATSPPLCKYMARVEAMHDDFSRFNSRSLWHAAKTDELRTLRHLIRRPDPRNMCISQAQTTLMRSLASGKAQAAVELSRIQGDIEPIFLNCWNELPLVSAVLRNLPVNILRKLISNSPQALRRHWSDIASTCVCFSSTQNILAISAARPSDAYPEVYLTKLALLEGNLPLAITIYLNSDIERAHIRRIGDEAVIESVLGVMDQISSPETNSTSLCTKDGYTALMLHASVGSLDACKRIIENSPFASELVERRSPLGATALLLARKNRKENVVLYLEKLLTTPIPNACRTTPASMAPTRLMLAASADDLGGVWGNIGEAGCQTAMGMSALMFACDGGCVESAKILVSFEAGLVSTLELYCLGFSLFGATALMFAAGNGNLMLVRLLSHLEAGMADINGRTALMLAARLGQSDVVECLLTHEAGIQDVEGRTALHYALMYGNSEAARLLVRHECRLVDRYGVTPSQLVLASDDPVFREKMYHAIAEVPETPRREPKTRVTTMCEYRLHLGTAKAVLLS
ncbi:Ankyrin repeat protein 1 [Giardia muris]|uniref:Ankyrin repeat protein 1 n=1 Tax=Giardia muris TaxID=5742 RepID=A0A4Z1T0V1_GIAMU|nr:Ankyrin repeat protein 1 [Giardia muris]|eukprot:TNJ26537.1 Ankyrin repeat protein 1 [Giardia muris]